MATAKQIDFLLTGLRHPDTDEPLVGGKVYTYEAGTTTPKATYTDRDTAEGEATNPIILSATGNAEVYGNGVYKFTITDADDVTVFEFDNVEYTANITESGVGPLTSDLDFNGKKGINLGAGSEAGDTVEWQQWRNSVDTLEDADTALDEKIDALTLLDLTDTPTSYSGLTGNLLKVKDGADGVDTVTFSSLFNASSAQALTDIPSFTGEGGKILTVNTGGTEVELKTIGDLTSSLFAAQTFINLADVNETDYTSANGQAPLVVESTGKLEFGFPDAKTIQGTPVSATAPTANQILAMIGGTFTPVDVSTLVSSGSSLAGGLCYTKTKICIAGEGAALYNGSSLVQLAPVAWATFDSGYYVAWDRPFVLVVLIWGNAVVGTGNANPYCVTQMATASSASFAGGHRVSCSNFISPGGFNYGEIGSVFFMAPS